MSDLLSTIHRSIVNHNLLSGDSVVIVALSGGADSVALLSALCELGYDCIAAHCNFHLRGDESDRDERHAADTARRLGAKYEVIHFDTEAYASAKGISIEMAARELRYEWFERLRQQYGAEAIAVAHHRDDNIETFFLNLLRGTGIAGLTAMSPRRGCIIRPMLDLTRADILSYLQKQNLSYVTDSTNADIQYRRNRLRNVILPLLNEHFPGADEAIAHTIACLQSNEAIYRKAINDASSLYFHDNKIDLEKLIGEYIEPSTLLFELLHPYGFTASQIGDIISSHRNTGSRFLSPTHIAVIDRGHLLIDTINRTDTTEEYQITLTDDVSEPIGIAISKIDKSEFALCPKNSHTLFLDKSVLDGNPTFRLRRWRIGDRIAPFGMRGTKKVSDIFSNARMSALEKQSAWLLTRDDEILWIVGVRASRHFPVTDDSSHIVRLIVAQD